MSVVIGLDYGLRRIGIAVSDPDGRVAFAFGTHVEGRDGSVFERLRALARERDAVRVVVGLPLTADGREAAMAERARRFAGRLQAALALPVSLLDERYSSREAAQWIGLRGRPARRGEIDAVAAQIILQIDLDRRRRVDEGPP
ncbi:MAG TPA: Holliday junction resolvase RuvX [Candidatus Krumholzibacteria bacterium]|nr:Holliday junction resolvase RuvX [Candidatus Krumholzibacteria bacterium]HPD71062.1 Holliday junction resolvase RuvX [Candidatus Krumholzibacteria bacterium]HRY39238.1 Holliday junction resolvase RuvX [Candidatus Krumholzibacteria bacterium]